MLRPRIIPCLLLQGGRLVKTVGFGPGKYVGDPLNAVRIFNEKSVDELMVVDIDATSKGTEPDYRLIESLAVESRMPLGYGGGVHSVRQAARIVHLGVEKVAFSSAAIAQPGARDRTSGRGTLMRAGDARHGNVAAQGRTGLIRGPRRALMGCRPPGAGPAGAEAVLPRPTALRAA